VGNNQKEDVRLGEMEQTERPRDSQIRKNRALAMGSQGRRGRGFGSVNE